MQRKEFLQQCGAVCLGALTLGSLLESCGTAASVRGSLAGDTQLTVPLRDFNLRKGSGFKRYLIIRNDALNYPIVVYRESASEYRALLLRCTHQYNELNVSGELLSCPAHGSEFNTKGEPVQGPADTKLREFGTRTDDQNLYIQLT